MPDPIFEDVGRPLGIYEKPSLHWIGDGDWVRYLGILIWLLQTFLAIAFCIAALVAFSRGEMGTAIVMALLGVVLKTPYGWRG